MRNPLYPTKYLPEAVTRQARRLAALVRRHPDFVLAAPVAPGVVTFRAMPEGVDPLELDALNAQLRQRVNDTGEVYLSYLELRGHYVLRLLICCLPRAVDADRAWEVVTDAFLGILLDATWPGLRWDRQRTTWHPGPR